MKIAFISHRLTPHQIPFSEMMACHCEEYVFLQMKDYGESWTSKGEEIVAAEYPYLRIWKNNSSECEQIINTYDVIITEPTYLKLLVPRMKNGGMVFVYLERFFKQGIRLKNFVRTVIGMYLHHIKYQKYKPFLLCAGGYCAGDAKRFGCYINRTFKWGYYPYFEQHDIEKLMSKKEPQSIMWAGRLIDWKHPEMLLALAEGLRTKGINARIKLYGSGEMEEYLCSEIEKRELREEICMMGKISAKKIREEMKRSSIFICTSDYEEGWGAVLNEAMNSGCAVVASHAMGAAPFLIEDGKSGCIFRSGDNTELINKVLYLLDNFEVCTQIGKNAYCTISDIWNSAVAAERFIAVCEALLKKEDVDMHCSGPCSIAMPIKQDDMYDILRKEY